MSLTSPVTRLPPEVGSYWLVRVVFQRGLAVTYLLAFLVAALSIRPTANMLSEMQVMNSSFDPLKLVNTYGAFGSVTTDRFQLVVEGTTANNPTEDDW